MDRDFNSQIITFMEHFCYSQEIAAAAAPVAAPTTTLQEKAKSLDISNLLEPIASTRHKSICNKHVLATYRPAKSVLPLYSCSQSRQVSNSPSLDEA
jgi:hypothetical protein